ncbi:O-antigen ligase [Pedobacter sp. L105]|uniref:O-antigen ligase family protein n=1 Tax=Pedobacter sp. L105 TaxID=1641871 RepID=UPI00131E2DED|nr:O-antigen ligase family protein [Pedobacter sp. L105]
MRELFFIRDNLANKISYYHVLLFMASLPFDRFYSHLILISLIVHTLIHFKREAVQPVFNLRMLMPVSVLLITIGSTIYSINRADAYNEWSKQITVLLFPLVFCVNPLDLRKCRASLLLAFSLVCTATVTYLYLDAIWSVRYYGLPVSSLFSYAFTNHNFASPIDMHATYLSMQLAIALIYLFSVLIKERGFYDRLFYLACIGILSAGLVQLGAKSVCFCVLLIVITAVPWFLLKGSARWKFMLITASISLLSLLLVVKQRTFRERYINDLRLDLSTTSTGLVEDPRVARWYAAGELVARSPLIGYGAGSEIALLRPLFFDKKFYNSYLHRLNAHNQYLSFLIKSGVIGLLAYMVTLIAGFRLALRRKDLLFFLFLVLVTFVSISENILDVDKGILFYAFFFSFFVYATERSSEIVEI